MILAGAGVLRARCSNDLVRFAELLHVPVIASLAARRRHPQRPPAYLGMTGFGSPRSVRERLEAADALLVLGSRLSEPTTFGYRSRRTGQRWVHVDLEPRDGCRRRLAGAGAGDPGRRRAFLRAAVARLKEAVLLAEPVARARPAQRRRPGGLGGRHRRGWRHWDGPGVHPGRIVADLRRLLPEDAILTTDAGASPAGRRAASGSGGPGTFLGPTSGAMGYGLPAAIAAALVHRERRVVALVGDGGMGMTMAEVETAVREGAHVVAIVFDNERYGMIRAHQDRDGSPTAPGTDLGPVDFAAAARACGARGVRVETRRGVRAGALRTALAASGPTVIQLVAGPPLGQRGPAGDRLTAA